MPFQVLLRQMQGGSEILCFVSFTCLLYYKQQVIHVYQNINPTWNMRASGWQCKGYKQAN